MGSVLNVVEQLAITCWLGAIVFFSFVVAPTAFRVLGEANAGRLVRAVFPKYYLLGIVCGVLLAGVQLARGFLYYWGGMIRPALILFTLLTLLSIYARQILVPAANAARDSGESGRGRFRTLHRRSVMLNGFVLLCGLLYLLWMGMRGY
jgi:hypothetical protein